jgi:alpha-glucosidase (family GH31 glycosyl hydrolase)
MPIYVRAGAIIPFDPVRQYTSQPVSQPTTLRIYPGADGDFTLYDDDGISQQYLQGKAMLIHLSWDDHSRTLTIEPGPGSQPVHRKFVVRVMTMNGAAAKTVEYGGKRMDIRM